MNLSKKIITFMFLSLIMVANGAQEGKACSTFFLKNDKQLLFGRNYDWMFDDALLIVNKRNMSKIAIEQEHPLSWVSEYGSVTFNQYGREFPHGGINEAGLVVEVLWLNETEYAEPDTRAGLNMLQWVQYQLDTASSVAEVLASDTYVQIVSTNFLVPLHYLVCDLAGSCATIEFLNGKMVTHAAAQLPVDVLTNSTYAASIEALRQYDGFGGTMPMPTVYDPASDDESRQRFILLADRLKRFVPTTFDSAVKSAFEMLTSVSNDVNQWGVVYDMTAKRVYFRTRTNPQIRSFDLSAFDFSNRSPVKTLDVNSDEIGNVSAKFAEYTPAQNQVFINRAFKQTNFLVNMPEEIIMAWAQYPESTTPTDIGVEITSTPLPTAVPEPSTIMLIGLGVCGIGAAVRRKGQTNPRGKYMQK